MVECIQRKVDGVGIFVITVLEVGEFKFLFQVYLMASTSVLSNSLLLEMPKWYLTALI